LNITNGDSAVHIMKRAGISGTLLPWRDVLHDGPVPAGLSLTALSEVRARFITARGWGDQAVIEQDFIDRDRVLQSSEHFEKVILWFEHDLYDQLQLLQILDWYQRHRPLKTELAIICVDQYLGTLSPEQMASLQQYERVVSEEQLALAKAAWDAYRSATPLSWRALLQTDTTALPYLAGAVVRQLEEYPDCRTGLSRTARQALQIIANGEIRPGRVFGLYQQTEDRVFMGDASFWAILDELIQSKPPLILPSAGGALGFPPKGDTALTITTAGEDVLAGKLNWLDCVDLDRWIGGVHITLDAIWCWDAATASLSNISSKIDH
jgi:hypothetical protein